MLQLQKSLTSRMHQTCFDTQWFWSYMSSFVVGYLLLSWHVGFFFYPIGSSQVVFRFKSEYVVWHDRMFCHHRTSTHGQVPVSHCRLVNVSTPFTMAMDHACEKCNAWEELNPLSTAIRQKYFRFCTQQCTFFPVNFRGVCSKYYPFCEWWLTYTYSTFFSIADLKRALIVFVRGWDDSYPEQCGRSTWVAIFSRVLLFWTTGYQGVVALRKIFSPPKPCSKGRQFTFFFRSL